jgi:hypothetical protein
MTQDDEAMPDSIGEQPESMSTVSTAAPDQSKQEPNTGLVTGHTTTSATIVQAVHRKTNHNRNKSRKNSFKPSALTNKTPKT